jgi:DNA-directed RNA polymerase subunit K/omega
MKMNRNLRVLDIHDKKENIYSLISELASRSHRVINGAVPSVEVKDADVVQVVLEEEINNPEKEK